MAVVYSINGRSVSRKEFCANSAGVASAVAIQRNDHWRNHTSLALSVTPESVQEFNQQARDAGLTGVHYDQNGDCHIRTRDQRRKLLALRGLHDKQAGYGD